mmetsp:Transcript_115986/g.324391  ORF Transcript_115986/g.324391 Transcript_115986/m.324391 type:complete len:248 (+) Transcript_115986:568-1311(+)
MGVLKLVLVLRPQAHDAGHVDLLESRQHASTLLRVLHAPGDGLAHAGQLHALLGPGRTCGRGWRWRRRRRRLHRWRGRGRGLRRRGLGRLGGFCWRRAAGGDRRQGLADLHRLVGRHQHLRQDAGHLRPHLNADFVRLDQGQQVPLLDILAGLLAPLLQGALGDAFGAELRSLHLHSAAGRECPAPPGERKISGGDPSGSRPEPQQRLGVDCAREASSMAPRCDGGRKQRPTAGSGGCGEHAPQHRP